MAGVASRTGHDWVGGYRSQGYAFLDVVRDVLRQLAVHHGNRIARAAGQTPGTDGFGIAGSDHDSKGASTQPGERTTRDFPSSPSMRTTSVRSTARDAAYKRQRTGQCRWS